MRSKKLIAALLVVVMGMSQFTVAMADKKSDAEQKKKEAEESLKTKQGEINRIQEQQEQLRGEINALDAELVNVMIELSTLEEELAVKQDDLEQTKADLEQAKEDEKNQYEAMKIRIRFMYEKGDTAMLTTLLESGSIADLLNRVEYVNEVYEYDRNLLTDYQNTKDQVAALEKQQEEEIQVLEAKHEEYEVARGNYETMIAQKKDEVGNFQSKLKEAQALASKYQDTINAQNTIIAQENERIERERREQEERERAAAAAAAAAAVRANSNSNSNSNSSSGGSSSGGSSDNGSSGGGGNKNPGYSTGVSGSAVVNYAMNFVGNPYVWGGKDPNTGADCSGFTSYVYAHFGISIPSYSYSQRSVGQEVSYANAKAGDLICYAGHVAIYMGNGQIVHAKGTAYGIVAYDNATYRPIITVRRVL